MPQQSTNSKKLQSSSSFLSGINLNCVSVEQLPDPPTPTSHRVRRSSRIQKLKNQKEHKLNENGDDSLASFNNEKNTGSISNILKKSKDKNLRRRSSPNLTLPPFQFCDKEKKVDLPFRDVTNKKQLFKSESGMKKVYPDPHDSSNMSTSISSKRRRSLSIIPSHPLSKMDMDIENVQDEAYLDAKRKRRDDKSNKKRRQSILLPSDEDENDDNTEDDENDTLDLAKLMDYQTQISIQKPLIDHNYDKYKTEEKRNLLPPTHKKHKSSKDGMHLKTKALDSVNVQTNNLDIDKRFSSNNRFSSKPSTVNKQLLSTAKMSKSKDSISPPFHGNMSTKKETSKPNPGQKNRASLVQNIRRYCALPISERESTHCSLATTLQNMTQYPFPMKVNPLVEEKTSQDLTEINQTSLSFENKLNRKRDFLLKMGPIVQQMEESREKEASRLENITKYRVTSKKGLYKYVHIETNKAITPKEYEVLYLACIKKKKIVNEVDKHDSRRVKDAEDSNNIEKSIQSLFEEPLMKPALHADQAASELGMESKLHQIQIEEKSSISVSCVSKSNTKESMTTNEKNTGMKSVEKHHDLSKNPKDAVGLAAKGLDSNEDPLIINAKKKLHESINKALAIYSKEVLAIRAMRRGQKGKKEKMSDEK